MAMKREFTGREIVAYAALTLLIISACMLPVSACWLLVYESEETERVPVVQIDAEQNYYLGFYQGCVGALLAIGAPIDPKLFCVTALYHMYLDDLYYEKQLPKGWLWPPPTPTPASMPTLKPVEAKDGDSNEFRW